MLTVISPSKDLNYKSGFPAGNYGVPGLWERSWEIVEVLKLKKSSALQKLMDISQKIADENVLRNKAFAKEFTTYNSKPAIFAFAGDVYRGLDALTLNTTELHYCQKHLRILSGLYGLLHPFDLMQPYRLEMGTSIKIGKKKNLYHFWQPTITKWLVQDLTENRSQLLINLASKEYFEAIDLKNLNTPVLHIHFREFKNNKLLFVSYTAKRARGLVVRFMAQQNLQTEKGLKNFNLEKYQFASDLSDDLNWYFVR